MVTGSHLLALANYLPPYYYNYIAKLSLQYIASYLPSSKLKINVYILYIIHPSTFVL